MIFTLHRYIFRELFKVFALASIALTLMLSIGSILQPVSEYGVGPGQVLDLMLYFMPITLTFVLPMAAVFAASLVYGRLAGDNELDACRASGVSLLTLVYPGFVLAVIVAIANLVLSFYVTPIFVHHAESSLKDNAKQILFRNIQQRGYYRLPPDNRFRIYADQARAGNDALLGVIVAEVKNNEIHKLITAERADIKFRSFARSNEVRITAYNTYQMASADQTGFSSDKLSLTTEFGSLLGDDIKFKKIGQIKRIRSEPILFYPIDKKARQLYRQFATELLAQDIRDAITDKPAGFYRMHSGSRLVRIRADECSVRDEFVVRLTGDVMVEEYDISSNMLIQKSTSSTGLLHVKSDQFEQKLVMPTVTIELRSATAMPKDGVEQLMMRYLVRGLILPDTVKGHLGSEDILASVSPEPIAAALRSAPSGVLTGMQKALARKLRKTAAEIDAEVHSRLVFGIGCITIIMMAIALGIIQRAGHLLTAFGSSSIPAAALIVCIMMGKNITKNPGSAAGSGVLVMWASLLVLTAIVLIIYKKLVKH